MHRAYERYVIEEAIPFIKHKAGWFDPMVINRMFNGMLTMRLISS